ncbi:F-box domain containing protein [Trema orientale]|uniref:F-box domain containing protein n=1 Tax=Trema orientale TaxID=63057 RepID=A0A2P5APG3_TREOI|nr:F-box domain containing protein [Trema orientale]
MDADDRLSELPEEVIHRIMYLLPTLEATRMSALSKRFLSTWRSFPVMDFDTDLQLLCRNPKHLFNFVVGSLERRRTCVDQRLSLKSRICGYGDDDGERFINDTFESVINFAIRSKTKELHLHYKGEPFFCLSMPIKSLLFSSEYLRSLRLRNVDFNDHHNLILSCPLIKDLKLSHCVGLQSIEINSAAKLIRAVKFKDCKALESIRIDSNTLESFTCIYDYHWQWPGSPDRVSDINLASPESLKRLRLANLDITDEWFSNNVSEFVGLERLELKNCSRLKNILITGENIKSLRKFVLTSNTDMEDVHIAAPSLEDLIIDQNPNPASLNIGGCKSNLRNLCICHFRVTDVWIQENLSGLRLLENFTFGGFLIDRSIGDTLDNEPKHNKLYFDSLKDLNLSVTYEPLLSSILEIEAPNLDCFTYECDEINAASAPLPLVCPNLTDVRLLLETFDRKLDDPMLHKILIDLLRSFGHCKTLSLSLCRDILIKFKISEQERETLSPPLYEVKHLTVSTGVFSSPFIVLWLFDTLLWLVPHPETISFNNTRNIHEVIVKASNILNYQSNSVSRHTLVFNILASERLSKSTNADPRPEASLFSYE